MDDVGAERNSLLVPVFDIRDYGAKCDGATDDSEALRRACAAATVAGGGTIYLPPGSNVEPKGSKK